jgi:hypothetical protein
MQLVEEAVEGCWIGHRARMFTSEIGSVYSPPDKQGMPLPPDKNHVETIIDIGPNPQASRDCSFFWIYLVIVINQELDVCFRKGWYPACSDECFR